MQRAARWDLERGTLGRNVRARCGNVRSLTAPDACQGGGGGGRAVGGGTGQVAYHASVVTQVDRKGCGFSGMGCRNISCFGGVVSGSVWQSRHLAQVLRAERRLAERVSVTRRGLDGQLGNRALRGAMHGDEPLQAWEWRFLRRGWRAAGAERPRVHLQYQGYIYSTKGTARDKRGFRAAGVGWEGLCEAVCGLRAHREKTRPAQAPERNAPE